MKYIVNIAHGREPDTDPRSLRARVANRDKEVLRDTYHLIDAAKGPPRRMSCGHTTVYPTGSTTGHSHDNMEEIYFVISGEGTMIVGGDEYPIKAGDCLYVPPGEFHTTRQTGILPLVLLWMTCKLDGDEDGA
ncbi:MAG: cupin domain-containing protein [Spirochaetes bacterium]|nr:cupin domain-containing protein [Spirochaetota bacterium]